jgi:hypothetical protein
MKKHFIIFLSILVFTPLKAQQNSIQEYMDDGGLSSFDRIIKISVTQALQGNLIFIWEKDLTGEFRVETGAGILTSAYYPTIWNRLYRNGKEIFYEGPIQEVKMKPGISFYISPRQSFMKYPAYYYAVNLNAQYYFEQLLIGALSITFGKEINLSEKWILDINAGVGFNSRRSFDSYYYTYKFMLLESRGFKHPTSLNLNMPVSVKLGYRL